MHIDLRAFSGDYYPFLTWLSTHLPRDASVVECGTHEGDGARALAHCGHTLRTCDPSNRLHGTLPPNARHEIKSCFDLEPELLAAASLIYLDISHNGLDESNFVVLLHQSRFRGVLVCDDIDMNPEMRAFWDSLPLPKHTISVGNHDTKIGLVSFSPAHTIES